MKGQSGIQTTTQRSLGTGTDLQISFTTRGGHGDLIRLRTIETETMIALKVGQVTTKGFGITTNLRLVALTDFKDLIDLRTAVLQLTELKSFNHRTTGHWTTELKTIGLKTFDHWITGL